MRDWVARFAIGWPATDRRASSRTGCRRRDRPAPRGPAPERVCSRGTPTRLRSIAERELENIQPIAEAIRRRRRTGCRHLREAPTLGAGNAARSCPRAQAAYWRRRGYSTLRRPDACRRHRRVHGRLQPVQRAAPGRASLPRSATPGAGVGNRYRRPFGPIHCLGAELPRLGERHTAVSERSASGNSSRSSLRGRGTRASHGIRASSSLFHVLGVQPALGRVFSTQEDAPGHRVAVISDALWRVHFAADPAVVGRAVRLNGECSR